MQCAPLKYDNTAGGVCFPISRSSSLGCCAALTHRNSSCLPTTAASSSSRSTRPRSRLRTFLRLWRASFPHTVPRTRACSPAFAQRHTCTISACASAASMRSSPRQQRTAASPCRPARTRWASLVPELGQSARSAWPRLSKRGVPQAAAASSHSSVACGQYSAHSHVVVPTAVARVPSASCGRSTMPSSSSLGECSVLGALRAAVVSRVCELFVWVVSAATQRFHSGNTLVFSTVS